MIPAGGMGPSLTAVSKPATTVPRRHDAQQEQQRLLMREVADFLCHHSPPLPCEAQSIPRRMSRVGASSYPAACMSSSSAILQCLRSLARTGGVGLDEASPVDGRLRAALTLVAVHTEVLALQSDDHAADEQPAPPPAAQPAGSAQNASGQRDCGSLASAASRPPTVPPGSSVISLVGTTPVAAAGGAWDAVGHSRRTAPTAMVELLSRPTLLESATAHSFKTDGVIVPICDHGTREACQAVAKKQLAAAGGGPPPPCPFVHVRRLIFPHTDETLGDCSYLSSCRRPMSCKYVHYELEDGSSNNNHSKGGEGSASSSTTIMSGSVVAEPTARETDAAAAAAASLVLRPHLPISAQNDAPLPAQWVNADVRTFDLKVLGQFGVILCDPPWNIRMQLPYGTMSDDEIRSLRLHHLQHTDGVLFLWVTGRCVELGRQLIEAWGYRQEDELVWVKTNQLQSLIRTGRTGHWLNHSKEHCLVAVKGSPRLNRGLDCDVLVSEVRDPTSRKPDELYGIIDRMCPGTRKIELFGRMHNVRPGWVTLGNQLPSTRLVEPQVLDAFRKRYPEARVQST